MAADTRVSYLFPYLKSRLALLVSALCCHTAPLCAAIFTTFPVHWDQTRRDALTRPKFKALKSTCDFTDVVFFGLFFLDLISHHWRHYKDEDALKI